MSSLVGSSRVDGQVDRQQGRVGSVRPRLIAGSRWSAVFIGRVGST